MKVKKEKPRMPDTKHGLYELIYWAALNNLSIEFSTYRYTQFEAQIFRATISSTITNNKRSICVEDESLNDVIYQLTQRLEEIYVSLTMVRPPKEALETLRRL